MHDVKQTGQSTLETLYYQLSNARAISGVPAVDAHPLMMEVMNTFRMDAPHHFDADPLRHYALRQADRAVRRHGSGRELVLETEFHISSERPPALSCTLVCLVDAQGDIRFKEFSCICNHIDPHVDSVGLSISVRPAEPSPSEAPLRESLHQLYYR